MNLPFVMVAPTGARLGRADHPALPVSLDQITECASACHAAGANGLHLHVRDDAGRHSLDAGRYLEALSELTRVVPGLRIQITTEAAGIFSVADQLTCLRGVRPDWVSISVREIARSPELAPVIYRFCAENGIEVQHILHDTGDIALLLDWRASGTVPRDQNSLLFVLGRYSAGQVSTPADLAPFLKAGPGDARWMLCAFGPQEHECLLAAAQHGGDVRVGFENSRTAVDGRIWTDNAASVRAPVRRLSDPSGRPRPE
ncbi:MAG: 3-keto-5-aminohexanoate cleavage protein [Roseovarius sp.]|nr:3-keto-5-aminohexanoate cleavage protein [Roseovarius sp.]